MVTTTVIRMEQNKIKFQVLIQPTITLGKSGLDHCDDIVKNGKFCQKWTILSKIENFVKNGKSFKNLILTEY